MLHWVVGWVLALTDAHQVPADRLLASLCADEEIAVRSGVATVEFLVFLAIVSFYFNIMKQ